MLALEDLKTFVAVADAGGLTPAARRLGLSKSIVSRRLLRLERTLRVQLLTRTTRGAALTEAGATFREHAARALAELDAARDALSPDGDLCGLLRISAPLSYGPTHLSPVLAEFASRYPRLRMDVSYTDQIVDVIGEGYDAAIRIGSLPDSSLVARRIAPVRAHVVASPAYIEKHGTPRTLDELLEHEAVLYNIPMWRLTDRGRTVTIRPRGRFRTDNGMAVTAAALAGVGIALLPDFLAGPHLESGRLVELLPQHRPPDVAIYVVRPPGRAPRKVAVLTELIVQRLGRR
ncbi:MAG: LysR substrate-binding domain-containing protein [Pseudomonadota bacterium]|nr:MAG: LysR family transcriptional regulator [Pseudomonadota bacterium]